MEKKLVIFGSYSSYNKGDLAILISMINNLLVKQNTFTIYIPSKKPKELKELLPKMINKKLVVYKTITAYWGMDTIKYIKAADLLIFGGGGLFFSKKKFNIFYNHVVNLFFITLVNKLFFNKPIYLFSVGVTYLNSKIVIFMTNYILRNANYITVRDNYTYNLFSKYKIKNLKMFYDPAFLLDSEILTNRYIENFIANINSTKKIIIIMNSSVLLRLQKDRKSYDALMYIAKELQKSFHVVLSYNTTKCNLIRNYYNIYQNNNMSLFHPSNLKPEEIIYLYKHFDYVITAPMHAAIFSYLAGTKMITIEFDQKVRELNKIIGNKNSVNLNNLENILWIIDNYSDIDWEYRRIIKNCAASNFINLHKVICDD